ncbi:MAG: cysteine dioxygenase [Rikenellaceae bacterium]|nr:cysteine dioxygenase [Rikenellaceae bacterium]
MQKTQPFRTLAGQFPLVSAATDRYGSFFGGLLSVVRNRPVDNELGENIKDYVLGWLSERTLEGFDEFSDRSYVRTYLGRCPDTHWEAILMSWKQGNATAIHAHPQFAGYHFADGVFRVEIFEPTEAGKARLVDTMVIDRPQGLFAIGNPGRFDNHIHRITCLSETGHSLHVYSEDALKGEVYHPATL